MKALDVVYAEYPITTIFDYFVKGFDGINDQPKPQIERYEANYDPRTGRVIFRLYVKDAKKD